MLFKELSKRLVDTSREPKAGFFYLGRKISIAIQYGNTASLLDTFPVDGEVFKTIYFLFFLLWLYFILEDRRFTSPAFVDANYFLFSLQHPRQVRPHQPGPVREFPEREAARPSTQRDLVPSV